MKPTVFVSHIHEDRSTALALAKYIERAFSRAVEVFVSSDGTSILLGDKWLDRIEEGLRKASIVIVIASPNSVARPWINFEAGGGWLRGARVMPVCIRGMQVASLPQPLRSLQACEIATVGGTRTFFEGLAKVLDLDCGISEWQDVADQLSSMQMTGTSGGDDSSAAMPDTWSPDNRDFGWVSTLDDPEFFAAATSLVAVRQACYEDIWRVQRNPTQYSNPTQSECRMYTKAINTLRKRFGTEFAFEPLDDKEGYATNPSAGWLLKLCDNALAFLKRKMDSTPA